MQHKNLIAGEWCAEQYSINVSPSDATDVIGEFASATEAETAHAIAAAAESRRSWKNFSDSDRADILDAIGAAILARKQELGEVLSREEGKVLPEGVAEAVRAGNTFKFFAGQVFGSVGARYRSRRANTSVHVVHAPVGAVGIITPWNFPLAVPAWKIAPALAYGNTVVFKPAEIVSASGWKLAEIIHEAGVPAGVFNLVMGRGSVVGNAMANSTDLDAITFTGSTEVGLALAQTSIARGNKRVQAELGGKNSVVVLDDARLDIAVSAIVDSAFGSTGQRCTASSRIIATGGIYHELVDRLSERVSSLRVGHALDESSQIGPVASEEQLDQDLNYLNVGLAEGARLMTGGQRVERGTRGNYLQPALFADGNSRMRINQEEIFGPIACVIPASDADEALAVANDTQFGLSSGIFSESHNAITAFLDGIDAGLVSVNCSPAISEPHAPFGGTKMSGFGPREQGTYAREFYTTVATRYIATTAQH